MKSTARFDYHLRYQPCQANGTEYVEIEVGKGLQVFDDCENKDLLWFAELFQMKTRPRAKPLPDRLIQMFDETRYAYIGPYPIKVKVPVGNANKLEQI